jgi:putative membrane protein
MSQLLRLRRTLALACFVGGSSASPALAHEAGSQASDALWTAWSWEPGVMLALTLAAWLYVRGVRALWQASTVGRGIGCWEATAFGGGWLVLTVALLSPLHVLGGFLFSAHMLQHELLMLIAAPLLVLGRPLIACLRGLPLPWRRAAGTFGKITWARCGWQGATRPLMAWSLQAVALWLWHVPGVFQAALGDRSVHTLQHLSFLASAGLFWWALIRGRHGLMGSGAAVLYVFTTSAHSGMLGALLTFAPLPWYPAYAGTAAAWGLTPLEDQQLGGLLMWVPGSVPYLIAGLALLVGWLRTAEGRVRRWESQALPGQP